MAERPQKSWAELFGAADALGSVGGSVEWHARGSDGEVVHFSFPVYSPVVDSIVRRLYDVRAIVAFDWMGWDGVRRYAGGQGLAEAPVADAARLATAIVRGERFSDGTIAQAIAEGTLGAVLARLRCWREENPPE